MSEYKDKNGNLISEGSKVKYFAAEYEITKFMINMKGVYACGEQGCFPVKLVELIEPTEEINEEKSFEM